MDVHEAIFSRRAVRAYEPRPVAEETLRALLAAAVQAPSAMNRQPWLFAVIQDRARLQLYSDRAKQILLDRQDTKSSQYAPLLRDPGFNIFYDSDCLVAIGVADPGPYSEADCWLAAGNLMLAARAAGLGSCCIGFAIPVLNIAAIKSELGIPRDGAVIAPVIVGYPAIEPQPVSRAEPHVVSWSR